MPGNANEPHLICNFSLPPLMLNTLNLVVTDRWLDLISGQELEQGQVSLTLAPYQSVWLTNKPGSSGIDEDRTSRPL